MLLHLLLVVLLETSCGLHTQAHNVELENPTSKLEKAVQGLVEEMRDMQVRMTSLEKKINGDDAGLNGLGTARSATLAFEAKLVESTTFNSGATILFPSVDLNAGNAYDGSRSIFTCPLDGIYYFTASVVTTTNYTPGKSPGVEILRAAAGVAGLYAQSADDEIIMMSNSVLTFCAASEEISVRAFYNIRVNNSIGASSFSGFYLGQ